MTFKKGQSGNPGGKRKKTDAERQAEAMLAAKTPELVEKLATIVDSGMYNGEALTVKDLLGIVKLWLDKTRVGEEEGFPETMEDFDTSDWLRLRGICDEQLRAEAEASGLMQ